MLEENIEYIEGLKRFGVRLGLEKITELMEALENPHKDFRSIHIAGTNGKGSTSSMISSILKESGLKTGLYLSPYVEKFNERIQINGEMISDEELESLIVELKEVVDSNNIDVTFFEFITALAFMHFSRQKVDIAVVEVGMGGRLDATNVIIPEFSVITNIGLDHEKWLGMTKLEIAGEKAGIIKPGVPCITAEIDEEITNYFHKICKENGSELIFVDEVISAESVESNLDFQRFKTSGLVDSEFKTKLLGKHQIRNALLAIAVCRQMDIGEGIIRNGLEKAIIRGRLEVVSKNPLIILDGAHNIAGMEVLVEFVKGIGNRKALILGMSNDKPADEMSRMITPLFENIIVTEGRFKPMPAEELAEVVRNHNENIIVEKDVGRAIELAKKMAPEGTILVAGSLYLVSNVLAVLVHHHNNLKPL
ncbi:hypothetical protein AUJ84_02470 [Candidatus Pacearchaeota archaeon CG1_02_32_132]|nr:MAG: hypothetical protein AUJ84_02470 [Candidatus Pacearchaeota archaeon CG1_02_32_132]